MNPNPDMSVKDYIFIFVFMCSVVCAGSFFMLLLAQSKGWIK
jgi:hypothetical protein